MEIWKISCQPGLILSRAWEVNSTPASLAELSPREQVSPTSYTAECLGALWHWLLGWGRDSTVPPGGQGQRRLKLSVCESKTRE